MFLKVSCETNGFVRAALRKSAEIPSVSHFPPEHIEFKTPYASYSRWLSFNEFGGAGGFYYDLIFPGGYKVYTCNKIPEAVPILKTLGRIVVLRRFNAVYYVYFFILRPILVPAKSLNLH